MNRTPGTAASGAKVARSVLRRRSSPTNPASHGRACPAQHSPTRNASPAGSRSRPLANQRRIGGEIRHVARDRLQRRLERARQSVERAVEVEPRHRRIAVRHLRDAGDRAHQPGQRRRHHGDNARATACQQRQIAQELQRIAEAFLLQHQHRASRQVRQARKRRQQAIGGQHAAAGLGQDPVLVLPRLGKSSGLQTRHGAVHPDLPIAGRARQRLVRTRPAPRRIVRRSSASCRDSPRTPPAPDHGRSPRGNAPPPR